MCACVNNRIQFFANHEQYFITKKKSERRFSLNACIQLLIFSFHFEEKIVINIFDIWWAFQKKKKWFSSSVFVVEFKNFPEAIPMPACIWFYYYRKCYRERCISMNALEFVDCFFFIFFGPLDYINNNYNVCVFFSLWFGSPAIFIRFVPMHQIHEFVVICSFVRLHLPFGYFDSGILFGLSLFGNFCSFLFVTWLTCFVFCFIWSAFYGPNDLWIVSLWKRRH